MGSNGSGRHAAPLRSATLCSGAPYVAIDGNRSTASVDQRIASLASRQHGVVARRQLRNIGLQDGAITARVKTGRLHPVLHGVYAVGHRAIGRHGEIFSVALVCGPGAVISHWTAAELLGLWGRPTAAIHVIAPCRIGRKIPEVRRHFVRPPESSEATAVDGIPCTTASRTIVDLAGSLGEWSLRRLVEQAAVLRVLDADEVHTILGRGRRRGAPRLRAVLTAWDREGSPSPRLRSALEARLLALVVEAGLPAPKCNVMLQLGGQHLEVDFLWEEPRLVIETDGERIHGATPAFRRDRWRDQLLVAAGYRTARVTWGQLEDEPEAVIARIRRMLAQGR